MVTSGQTKKKKRREDFDDILRPFEQICSKSVFRGKYQHSRELENFSVLMVTNKRKKSGIKISKTYHVHLRHFRKHILSLPLEERSRTRDREAKEEGRRNDLGDISCPFQAFEPISLSLEKGSKTLVN
ncbi:hypothetical protein CDAR_98481 [Caerostris darwini]|uniref:Uncharacterized protein n=1 Tax=Caerostris darwini TaxID=1538125 RepID=A0AAV4UG08_9ARAC|nr:hypothetical protein CDAR_98481 [Caerostris darwini]